MPERQSQLGLTSKLNEEARQIVITLTRQLNELEKLFCSGMKASLTRFNHLDLVVVNVDFLQKYIIVSRKSSGRIELMFFGDGLPKCDTDLVSALTGLDVDDFTNHGFYRFMD